MPPYRIAIADEHALVRAMIREAVGRIAGTEIVGEAGDGHGLLALVKDSAPDLVLLDTAIPKMRGLKVIRQIKRLFPAIKVMVLSVRKSQRHVSRALSGGG